MIPLSKGLANRPILSLILFIFTVGLVIAALLLANNISERKIEAQWANKPIHPVTNLESRNEIWGEIFPKQFESYYATSDTSFKSKHGGNAPRDMLAEFPNLVVLWAGYAFSKDYKQGRGHFYAMDDIHRTLRTGAPKGPEDGPLPTTCWTCKSPDVPRLMEKIGPEEFYKGKWASRGHQIANTIGCADCHDNKTMKLKITRPALKEAFMRMGKDIDKSTHQEMRSLVCAQCHVEYYFKKSEGSAYLTFPWDKGFEVENIEAYYDSINFSDWTHDISKAPMLKAQHPDYEIYSLGIHAQRGVACADCHMPYVSEGGQKYTNHKIQSPLNHINVSCQVCHRESEEILKKNVYDRQDKITEIRKNLEKDLVTAHYEAGKAWELGATEDQMKDILKAIRHAQWRWDYGIAGHGSSFHAPLETARILSSGLAKASEARLLLTKLLFQLGFEGEVKIPDISTKEKAQAAIGLPMSKLKEEKQVFIETLLEQWKLDHKKSNLVYKK